MTIGKLCLCMAFVLNIAGCASVPPPPQQGTDPAAIKLAEAASNVSHSLVDLAAIEQAANPQARLKPPPNPSSYGMGDLTSIDWSGPIGPLVARIARATNYRLQILGTEPAIPIVVTIAAENTPLGDILSDAGYQAGSRADIAVFPSRRIIQLRYTPA
ncbi:MAG: type IVB secretion system lipoprotein DotD [Legionellales bacterium]|nr:type IVB secretion system lipoprotein DotD [Legionellales bacterium]